MSEKILDNTFYQQRDVVALSKELIGKVLHTRMGENYTSGLIIETEAYAGIIDKGSHAYNGRRTGRTEIMYNQGGCAYVYLCYGMHHLFNVVTSVVDEPHAILIRGIYLWQGIDIMQIRANKPKLKPVDGIGPGKVSKLLGITKKHTGILLQNAERQASAIWISDCGLKPEDNDIKITPRIGIDYAGEDALLPYRFVWDYKKIKLPA